MNYDTCIDFLMAKNINKMDWSYFDEWWTKFCNIMDSGGFEPGDSWSESDDDEPVFSSQLFIKRMYKFPYIIIPYPFYITYDFSETVHSIYLFSKEFGLDKPC